MTTTDKNQKQLAALPFWRRAAILFISTLRWVFRTFVAVITFVLISLFLVSAFSDWVNPESWLLAAYMGLFFPLFAVLLLVWTVLLILAHRWKNLVVALAVLLIGSGRLWRYCPTHFGSQSVLTEMTDATGAVVPIEADTLRVMTYNTHAMGGANLPNVKSKLPVVDLVRQSGADIVCLQEYAFAISKKGHHEQEIRARLKDIYPYYGFVNNKGRKAMGVALFSKYPIKVYEKIDDGKYYGAIAYAEIDYKGRKLALVNSYLQSFQIPNEERAFMHDMGVKFETDSIERVEKVLRNLSNAFESRSKQSQQVVDYLQQKNLDETTPLLVMGDMNDTPISYSYRMMRGELADSWEEGGFGLGVSFRNFPFWFRIDHIFHSSHMRVI
ncbi:MAG: endonuclease/exonuclease/phosphatase family protein, partial [Bacteroidales bacterium]|nr:endonuclease/exonuclease/phosphatase family protein [Bacteroidales bacterium]